MPSKEFLPRYASYPPFRLGRYGIGPLRHPFDDAALSAGAARTQWDLIQNPKGRIFRWRFEEEVVESDKTTFKEQLFNFGIVFSLSLVSDICSDKLKKSKPCWGFYLSSEKTFYIPEIKDDIIQWHSFGISMVSNYLRGEHFKNLMEFEK